MKKPLLLGLIVGGGAILAGVMLSVPLRFTLESTSPSGNARVVGLRFQGSKPHVLDGTLRLFVYRDELETRQQTRIPWGRDLKIAWKRGSEPEAFVVERNGHPQMEFQIRQSGIECSMGRELLAPDPYK
jgi:hypothetical protein